jgi:hypothetical protein
MLEIAAACRSDSTQPPARGFGQISFALILESMTIGDHAVGRLLVFNAFGSIAEATSVAV